jgi:lipopolysaccharide heptosyltransferase II
MKKVLVINPHGIGDVLFSTPLLDALRTCGAAVDYVGNARTAVFLREDPRLGRVLCYERDEFIAVYRRSPWQFLMRWKEFLAQLRAGQYDLAIDLSMGSPVGFAIFLAGIPLRLGYDHKGRGRWMTHKVPFLRYEGRHVVDFHLDLMGEVHRLLGSAAKAGGSPRTRMFVPQEDEKRAASFMAEHRLKAGDFVMICPGGGATWGAEAGFRHWAPGCYAQLADKIVEKCAIPIILVGDAADIDICREVAGAMKAPPVLAAGTTSLGQVAALMKQSRLVVMNDSGAMHVATACGVKPVVIFGPVDPRVYGPYPVSEQRVIRRNLPCQPCYRNFAMPRCAHRRCLTGLSVEDVFNIVKELL